MAHINVNLTRNIEIGAMRVDDQDGLEVITTDGGTETRNARVEVEPRRWQISLPTCDLSANRADYDATRQMWKNTERGLNTFNFYDFIEGEVCKVRFEGPLQITAPAGHLRHIDTFTLKEAIGE